MSISFGRTAWAGAAFAVSATIAGTAILAADPVHERHELMENVGKAAKAGGAMLKGEAEFDAGRAEMILRSMHNASLGFGYMFPDGATNDESEASPKIWEDRAGFEAKLASFQEAADAALKTPPADLEAFKQAFGSVTKTCKGCHESYRVKKD